MYELSTDYHFSDVEKQHLADRLLKIRENPYKDYEGFENSVDDIIASGGIPEDFHSFCLERRTLSLFDDPYVLLQNCPVDPNLPHLDFENPVEDKRQRKTTYAAEAFLLIYAKLFEQQPIGYINVNDGDVFQDIHPMKRLSSTQSQKALENINFHKDLANHFVRPDWVNILGLRGCGENKVYTCFVKNKEILESLPASVLDALRHPQFHTPYDDLTVSSSNKKLGRAPEHPILGGATDYDIRFFEKRTVGLTPEAQKAVDQLVELLHKLKKRLLIQPGDLIGSANNECIHNKEVAELVDPEALKHRWLMKTVNVKDLAQHAQHMREGSVRVVNG